MTDYTKMNGGEMLQELGDDAMKWADAFVQINGDAIAHDVLFGWFANAIEHSHDVRTGGGPVVMPDGSAFFAASI